MLSDFKLYAKQRILLCIHAKQLIFMCMRAKQSFFRQDIQLMMGNVTMNARV